MENFTEPVMVGGGVLPAFKSATRLLLRLTNPEGYRQLVCGTTRSGGIRSRPLRKRHPHMLTLEQYLTRHYAKTQ